MSKLSMLGSVACMMVAFSATLANASDKKITKMPTPTRTEQPADAQQTVPAPASSIYDYRGIALGISVSEFRTKESSAYPKQVDSRYNMVDVQSVPLCTSDANAKGVIGLRVERGTEDNGGVACAWAYYDDDKYLPRYRISRAMLGRFWTDSYSFNFIKRLEDTEARLYRIRLKVPESAFSTVALGLTDKFGSPNQTRSIAVKNKLGASFESQIMTWESAQSRIRLEQRYYDIENGQLVYELKDAAGYADEKINAALKASSKM